MSRHNRTGITRREWLQGAALAGLGTAFAPPLWAAAAATDAVITRRIPSTGEALPVIGIGTNQFGRAKVADIQALLQRMSELGGSVIDTAAMYGDSEANIGAALAAAGLRSKMFLATKFNAAGATFGPPPGGGGGGPGGSPMGGPPAGGPPMDTVTGIESFERSLKRLQTDKVDLLMAHFLSSVEPLMPVMLDLKKAGRIRYLGITAVMASQHAQLVEYMKKYPIDFVQVDYSLGERSSAAEVFPVAQQRKIAVMVAVPFGGGFTSLLKRAETRKLPDWAADIRAANWSQFLLKYVISHPAVTCAIPGTTSIQHMEDNQAAGRGVLPDAAMRKRMEAYWDAG